MSTPQTNRKLTLVQATSINMIDMVGIGPFVVMPMVITQFTNGLFLWSWIFGAFTALVDGMIWSELGARYPLAGGTYNFHRIAFGTKGGRLMSFLFVWQTSIQAPLVVASASIGFAQYLTYLVDLNVWQQKIVSGSLVVFVLVLLYRRIETIGKISVIFGLIVISTILWIIISGLSHASHPVKMLPEGADSIFQFSFWSMVVHGALKTVYSYLGYYNVCHLGGEIRNPQKNIPRSIFISIILIAILYLLMNFALASVMSLPEVAAADKYVVSSFMEQLYGHEAAMVVTVLILCIAMSSLFAVILGYSRVPYAAAVDGNFFRIFGRLHPTKEFPYVSLLMLCALGFAFSLLFKLKDVITAILAMRILVQFVAQGVGVALLRRNNSGGQMPFRMWLYPVPVIVSIIIWLFLFASTGWFALWGSGMAVVGVFVFYLFRRHPDQAAPATSAVE